MFHYTGQGYPYIHIIRVLYAENGGVSNDFIDNKLESTFIRLLHDFDMTVAIRTEKRTFKLRRVNEVRVALCSPLLLLV